MTADEHMVSLFMPVYNEERILRDNVIQVYEKLKELEIPFEFIIMDDTSTDGTPEIGRKLDEEFSEIRYLRVGGGPSRRENLLRAFKTARGDIIAHMDADLATDLSCLKDLLEYSKDFDIAVGSRYKKESKLERRFIRIMVSFILNKIVVLLFNSKYKDHFSGFKAYKREVLMDLIEQTGVGDTERGMFWDAEMLVRAQRSGYSIKTFPIIWREGEKTALNFRRESKMIPYMLKLRWRLWRGE